MEAIEPRDGQLVGAVAREPLKSAPRVHQHIEPIAAERDALSRHYGLAS